MTSRPGGKVKVQKALQVELKNMHDVIYRLLIKTNLRFNIQYSVCTINVRKMIFFRKNLLFLSTLCLG